MKRVPPWYLGDAVRKRERRTKEGRLAGKRSREKGKRRELELVKLLTEWTRELWWRGKGGVRDRDVKPKDEESGWHDHHFECKAAPRVKVMRWFEQADRQCKGRRPVAVWREDTPKEFGAVTPDWMASLRLRSYIEDQMELRELRDEVARLRRERDVG